MNSNLSSVRSKHLHAAVAFALSLLAFAGIRCAADETLVLLVRGAATNHLSYGLYCAVSSVDLGSTHPSAAPGGDLFLFLRNTVGKSIDLKKIKVSDFVLTDADGRQLPLTLRSAPGDILYAEVVAIHLVVDHPATGFEPWTLRFMPLDLTIKGISPAKAAKRRP